MNNTINWNIQRNGRAWQGDEAKQKYALTPEKIEMFNGKLFFSEEDRLNMLGLLMENVGIDKTLEICDTKVVYEAFEVLKNQ